MIHRCFALFLALGAAGPLVAEPVNDLRAFHAAWIVAQQGARSQEPAMIIGALDLFGQIAPTAAIENLTPLAVWDNHIAGLQAEALFLSRAAETTLPPYAPNLVLPAQVIVVPPGDAVATRLSGTGDHVALVLSGDALDITISDETGKGICTTLGTALFCPLETGQAAQMTLAHSGTTPAHVLVLGETP